MYNTVTVVPADRLIIIDNKALQLDFDAAPNLHALHWQKQGGYIETTEHLIEELKPEDYAIKVQPFVDCWERALSRQTGVFAPITPEGQGVTALAGVESSDGSAKTADEALGSLPANIYGDTSENSMCAVAPKVLPPQTELFQLLGTKEYKLKRIFENAEKAYGLILADYAAPERETWAKQLEEAQAVLKGGATKAPLLAALAEQRGLGVTELAERVLKKAERAENARLQILAQIQKYRNRLAAAKSPDEVRGIIATYTINLTGGTELEYNPQLQ